MRRLLECGLVLVVALGLTGCPVVPPFAIRGQVIDSETGQPISGAVVELVREYGCFGPWFGPKMTSLFDGRTGRNGRFTVWGLFRGAGCLFTGWSETDVRVVARGYHLWFSWSPEDRRSTPETIALHRLHWQSELNAYRENRVEWGRSDPRWREPIATVAKVRARPIGEAGVVARVPGAALDQVVVVVVRSSSTTPRGFGKVLLVRDGKSGRIHGVNASGRPVTLGLPFDAGWKAILGGFLLFRDDQMVYPRTAALTPAPSGGESSPTIQVETWIWQPGLRGAIVSGVWSGAKIVATDETGTVLSATFESIEQVTTVLHSLAELVPEATGPVECLMGGNPSGYLLVVPVRAGRALFLVVTRTTVDPRLRATRLRTLLPHRVGACTLRDPMVYLVQKDRIVRALLRVEWVGSGFGWEQFQIREQFGVDREFGLPGGAPPPVGLAAHTGQGDLTVLYAVNGTDTIYRLREDGVPDQRIEVEPE